jgi:GAF domain-containing protein
MHEVTEQKARLEEQLKNKESEIELSELQINQLQEELEHLFITHHESLAFDVDKIYSLKSANRKFKLSLNLLRYT